MRFALGLAVALVGTAGCKDVEDSPFEAVPLDGDFDVDVKAPVHVMRDEYGIAPGAEVPSQLVARALTQRMLDQREPDLPLPNASE